MTRARRFAQVDVFTTTHYSGNPVAVVLDAVGLDTATMQHFAAWTNLSETTFVLPPTSLGADYRLRIFTPRGELPFAGHPTLGSAHAWLEAGGVAEGDILLQECAAGLVPLRTFDDMLGFAAPPLLRSGPLDDDTLDAVTRGLGITRADVVDHQWVDNGPGWAAVRLASAEQVLALEPDDALMRHLMVGVLGAYPEGSPYQIEVRAFALSHGVREDPVTGSLMAGIAQWLETGGIMPPTFVASQGQRVGRAGRIDVRAVEGGIWVGGRSVTRIRGSVDL